MENNNLKEPFDENKIAFACENAFDDKFQQKSSILKSRKPLTSIEEPEFKIASEIENNDENLTEILPSKFSALNDQV